MRSALLPEVAMTKKRKLVLLAVAAVGLAAASLLYLLTLPEAPFWSGYDRIHPGMTAEEVCAILGEPAVTVRRNDPAATVVALQYRTDEDDDVPSVVIIFNKGHVTSKLHQERNCAVNGLVGARKWLGF
jgi:hypothetical protein